MRRAIRVRRRGTPALLALFGALAGCAVNPQEHFDQVAGIIYARTGQRVQWNTGGPEDAEVAGRVHSLLAHELDVEQAVQIGLLNNAELQATFEDLGIAQADLVQAGLLKNPVISAEIRFPGRPGDPVEVNVEEEFLELLFLPLRKSVAEASFDRAKSLVSDAVIRRAAELRVAFYRLQGAQQLEEMRRSVLEAAVAKLDASRRLREAGNIRELDYATAEGVVAQARVDVSEAVAASVEAREDLTSLMGLWGPDASAWKATPHLPDLPESDLPLAGLETLAVAQRQDLQAARNGMVAAARTAGFANYAAMLSGASVGAHDQRDADIANTIGPAIAAPIPIFDQGQAAGARAQAQFRQARDRYTALGVAIRAQVRQAWNRMTAARERALDYRNVILPLRKHIVEQTQLQYNGMFIGVSVLLEAKQDEINAGARYVEALRDYWVSRCALEQAVGGRLTEPGGATRPAAVPTTAPPRSTTLPAIPGREAMPGMSDGGG